MSFYEKIIPYYDEIFPLNQKAYQLIHKYFPSNEKILDIGAGTGTMAIHLANNHFYVTALEPDGQMIQRIREKTLPIKNLTLQQKEMQQLHTITDKFAGIYCIGNTLAHVKNSDELYAVLQQIYDRLLVGGSLLIQVVNFDQALAKQAYSFPLIQRESFTFARMYDIQSDRIDFTTRLTVGKEIHQQTAQLYPITSSELLSSLQQCGFKEIMLYGTYQEQPFTLQSPAIIVHARK